MGEEAKTSDEVIQFTQSLRERLVNKMTEKDLPEDLKEQQILLNALSDMDRTALANKRIAKDEDIANKDREAAEHLAKVYALTGNDDPFRVKGNVIEGKAERVPEMPDKLIDGVDFAPGEDEIGISGENYDEFARKTGLED